MTLLKQDLSDERRAQLIQTAQAVLKGQLGIILGSRKLQAFRFDLANDHDPDLLVFVGVDSETDHLPVDEERNNWDPIALARKDAEIAEAEAFFREVVVDGCRKLINRFGESARS